MLSFLVCSQFCGLNVCNVGVQSVIFVSTTFVILLRILLSVVLIVSILLQTCNLTSPFLLVNLLFNKSESLKSEAEETDNFITVDLIMLHHGNDISVHLICLVFDSC